MVLVIGSHHLSLCCMQYIKIHITSSIGFLCSRPIYFLYSLKPESLLFFLQLYEILPQIHLCHDLQVLRPYFLCMNK